MAFTSNGRAKASIGGSRMKNENPHRDGVAAGAVDSNEQTGFTTPSQDDQQNRSAQHSAPTCMPDNPSGCLVAVDLNCIEATELAAKILPKTTAVYDRCWFYLIKGTLSAEKFLNPVSDNALVQIRDSTAEFANVGASEIEIGELLKTVTRLAAFSLAKRYCEGVVDGDDESLICALDDVANPSVVDRIVLWLFECPSSDTVCDV
jgi:hypothetical protein